MKSARMRRETYFGTWLPEPVAMAPDEAPGDDLTLTLMLALGRLSPLERAAFLLHDVFAVPLAEIAATLQREPPAVRQLAARARKHVPLARPRFPVEREEGARIAKAFFEASAAGDISALRSMLADAVIVHSDGGGKVHAFPRPIVGIDKVRRMFEGAARKSWIQRAQKLRDLRIDGLPGYFSLGAGRNIPDRHPGYPGRPDRWHLLHPQPGQARTYGHAVRRSSRSADASLSLNAGRLRVPCGRPSKTRRAGQDLWRGGCPRRRRDPCSGRSKSRRCAA